MRRTMEIGGSVVCVDQYITAASIKAELRKENGLGDIKKSPGRGREQCAGEELRSEEVRSGRERERSQQFCR